MRNSGKRAYHLPYAYFNPIPFRAVSCLVVSRFPNSQKKSSNLPKILIDLQEVRGEVDERRGDVNRMIGVDRVFAARNKLGGEEEAGKLLIFIFIMLIVLFIIFDSFKRQY